MRSIIFDTPMVRALLDGRKTVARKLIRPQPKMRLSYCCGGHGAGKWDYPSPRVYEYWGDEWRIPDDVILTEEDKDRLWTPPCHTGDILYVKETWCRHGNPAAGRPMHYDYRADREDPMYDDSGFFATWSSSVHMPKDAARLFLKVTNVNVDRLQKMSAQDSLDEGIKLSLDGILRQNESPLMPFARYWDSRIKAEEKDLYGWSANPFVWIISFERCERPKEMSQ